jgi:hypothetical protein
MLRFSFTNRLGRRVALAGLAVLAITLLVGYGQYSSLLHPNLRLWYAIGASILVAGLFLRLVGMIIFPLGILIAVGALAHAVLVHFLDFRQLRFGITAPNAIEEIELVAVVIGAALGFFGYLFKRSEYDEYVASANTIHYRHVPQTSYVSSSSVQRSSVDSCARCGKEMGMFTHALQCPVCSRYWCADCCARNSDGELVCPVDGVDNMGRRG